MKSAKQKAKDLITRFLPHVYCYFGSGMLTNSYDANMAIQNARFCACAVAEEALEEVNLQLGSMYSPDRAAYWRSVIDEVLKIKNQEQLNEQ